MAKKKRENRRKSVEKISNNNYDQVDYHDHNMTFEPDPSFVKTDGLDDEVDHKLIYDKVDHLIKKGGFDSYNEKVENGKFYKLNKNDINRVYEYVCLNMRDYTRIELFEILSDYFGIPYNKFYKSLADHFKNELLGELRNRGMMDDSDDSPSLF